MTDVRIELPFPPKELSPNARVHWREKAKVTADYRNACDWAAALAGMPDDGKPYPLKEYEPLTPPVRAAVTFVVPDRRKRDMDNLLAMLKPAWDGLVDAGVLAGDDSERFSVESSEVVVFTNNQDVNRCSWCVARNHGRCHGVCNCPHEPKVIVELRSG